MLRVGAELEADLLALVNGLKQHHTHTSAPVVVAEYFTARRSPARRVRGAGSKGEGVGRCAARVLPSTATAAERMAVPAPGALVEVSHVMIRERAAVANAVPK